MTNKTSSTIEPLISIKEAASILGTSRWFLYLACETGKIRSVKVGRLRKIRQQDLRDYIDANSYGGGSGK